MTTRLATRIGLPPAGDPSTATGDALRFREPSVGALTRTKGSLYLLAQVTGSDTSLGRAADVALESIERDYYYDLSAGVLGALSKALAAANRRLYHGRRRLGIPTRGEISVIALAIRGREAHVAKLGPASAVIVRDGRMYEIPPPPAVHEEDPRLPSRRVAVTLGEALEIEPYTWHGELGPNDRLALVSRTLAQAVGVEELRSALAAMRPAQAVEHLRHLAGIRGGSGLDAVLAIEITEQPFTATTHHLEPVRPAEPLAGLPDQSPVPLADAVGRGLHRAGRTAVGARSAAGRGMLVSFGWLLAFVPRRRARYPQKIPRTSELQEGRRRRLGVVGMAGVALLLATGVTVGSLPSVPPTDAIPRATVAREAIAEAVQLVRSVEETAGGADLVDRDPDAARDLLASAHDALESARRAGVPEGELTDLRRRVDERQDGLFRVTRLVAFGVVADLAVAFEDVAPVDMVAASDGSLWVLDAGRGRLIRVDPVDGSVAVVYRAGEALPSGDVPGDPWMVATAATDVVLVDRDRAAWRIDLAERVPRRMVLAGAEAISVESSLLGALQHRPPLEIFTLYLVDRATGEVRKWTPPPVIPVAYPDPPEPYLAEPPDLDARAARDLRVDVNVWLLHSDTVTRVDFGSPRSQADYSLDRPPDDELRPRLDYRIVDGATVVDRDFLYVYDAANERIIAFGRADGAFVKQWLAARDPAAASTPLTDVRGLHVTSVADGPPVAYLLTGDRVLRLVLE